MELSSSSEVKEGRMNSGGAVFLNMIAQHFTQDFSFNSVVGAEQKYSQGQFTKTVKIKYSVSEVWVFPSFLSFFPSISVICLPTSTVDSTVAVKDYT